MEKSVDIHEKIQYYKGAVVFRVTAKKAVWAISSGGRALDF